MSPAWHFGAAVFLSLTSLTWMKKKVQIWVMTSDAGSRLNKLNYIHKYSKLPGWLLEVKSLLVCFWSHWSMLIIRRLWYLSSILLLTQFTSILSTSTLAFTFSVVVLNTESVIQYLTYKDYCWGFLRVFLRILKIFTNYLPNTSDTIQVEIIKIL